MKAKSDDAFEASEMHDGASVVHRDKRVSRGMAALLAAPGLFTIALAIFVGFANASSDKPVSERALPVLMAAMILFGLGFILLGIMFGVLRIVVTERAVHVRYGLSGPTIPLESIVSCKVVEYDWTEYGGWGIRRGRRGWAYVPSSGPVVEIEYLEGNEKKHVLIGGKDPHATVREIARLTAATEERVRVDASEERELAEESIDEAEAESERREEAKRRG